MNWSTLILFFFVWFFNWFLIFFDRGGNTCMSQNPVHQKLNWWKFSKTPKTGSDRGSRGETSESPRKRFQSAEAERTVLSRTGEIDHWVLSAILSHFKRAIYVFNFNWQFFIQSFGENQKDLGNLFNWLHFRFLNFR